MSRFSLLECSTWNDAAFQKLGAEARLLFLWSWTNPAATICGLYQASLRTMSRAISDDEVAVRSALEELERKPLVKYDDYNEVIWVVNRVKYANRSPKVARAMQREVTDCPPSPLVDEFVAMYGGALDLKLD